VFENHNQITLNLNKAFGEHQLNSPLKLLDGGYSSSNNYLVELNNDKYVYRELSPKSTYQNRKNECVATKLMSDKLIGAKCFYIDEKYTVIIIKYLDGRDANYNDVTNANEGFYTPIRKLHNLQINTNFPKSKTLIQRIDNYLLNVSTENNIINQSDLASAKKLYDTTINNQETCFVHGDLNHNNLRITNKSNILIDWADFGLGCPLEDISSLGRGISKIEQQNLLTQYFKRLPNQNELDKFRIYCHIHWLLLASWALEQLTIRRVSIIESFEQLETLKNINAKSYLKNCINSKIDLSNDNHLIVFTKACIKAFQQPLDIN